MPSGRTHDRITFWSFPIVAVAGFLRTKSVTLTLFLLGGFLFGALMLGPDLDTRSLHYRRWGFLRWIWIPYRGSLKHRSPLSHGPIIGTFVRVTYVLAWACLLGLGTIGLVNELFQLGWTWNEMATTLGYSLYHHRSAWIATVMGLEVGALSHYLADWTISTTKRVRKHYPQEGIVALRRIVNPSPKKKAKRKSQSQKNKRSPVSKSSSSTSKSPKP